jgi:hypothetical protein
MPTDRAPAARRQGRLEPARGTTRAGTPPGRQGRFLRPCSRLREKEARAAAVIRRTFLFKFGNGPFRAPSFQRGRQVFPGGGIGDGGSSVREWFGLVLAGAEPKAEVIRVLDAGLAGAKLHHEKPGRGR